MINLFKTVIMATLVLGLAACSPPVKEPERTGFISDYSNLEIEKDEKIELTEDEAYFYISDKLVNYRSFLIEDIVMLYKADPDKRQFEPEELDELLAYAHEQLERVLNEGDVFSVATEPGEGVARMRLAITDVDATIGALNVTSYTKVTGAGLGGAAIEGEIVDAMTGEQLGATIRWGGGSRFGRAGYTKLGDAKIILKRWADHLRDHLDEMHGLGKHEHE
jgi:hypothetical protein